MLQDLSRLVMASLNSLSCLLTNKLIVKLSKLITGNLASKLLSYRHMSMRSFHPVNYTGSTPAGNFAVDVMEIKTRKESGIVQRVCACASECSGKRKWLSSGCRGRVCVCTCVYLAFGKLSERNARYIRYCSKSSI